MRKREDKTNATRYSVGVILCRFNEKTKRPEVLLVHKRCTYAFADFVHGNYTLSFWESEKTPPRAPPLTVLVDQMSTEELIILWTLNFDYIWHHLWLSQYNTALYTKKKEKFRANFIGQPENGQKLKEHIQQIKGAGFSPLWEIPKGRPLNKQESDICCATRELQEETGVTKEEYRLLFPSSFPRVFYHVDAGVRYIYKYFIAIAKPELARQELHDNHTNKVRECYRMGEGDNVCWADIEKIRSLDGPDKWLEFLLSPAFKYIKNYVQGKPEKSETVHVRETNGLIRVK
ncbi:hypothetical protein RirG_228200 [Rhizophagus irregularis DAOM 197198w]|uniref:Nudix hydrolase domain-containing protein n=1 Tax=Rhizophagus irregularis (strain DAOM 197198w) TaxID=1432141 RepID=A0A015IDB9_RHIIW|nr:hypothetical protein RirG_228200 [Rhizophagus irregularis DAOM 197198w]